MLRKRVGKKMITDPIADMLIRIKNGYQAKKKLIVVPHSKVKEKLAKILLKEGYLEQSKSKDRNLELKLKYTGKKPALRDLKRISKPSLRVYSKSVKIPRVKQGFGVTIVSTSQGLMTDAQAKKKSLGGEIICQVW